MIDLLAVSPGQGPPLPWLRCLAEAGLRSVLVREPSLPGWQLREAIVEARALGVQVVAHERCPGAPEIARELGVVLHLKAGSAFPEQPFAVSAHDRREVDAALAAGAVYGLLSPVWSPSSKPQDTREPLGLERFLDIAGDHPPGRVLALGGVTPERLALLRAHGAGGAVLGALALPAGPELVARARAFR